ncbi:MAG: Ig domain-containing protein [Candidatus Pacearchaeota archaeon]|nr:Ig domain-containing protein [Candidatus Pacearchaeota archaeon]
MRCGRQILFLAVLISVIFISGCGVNNQSGVQITSNVIPEWTEGQPGSFQLNASGGTLPYQCEITSGALPPWATLNNCVISGTAPLLAGGSAQSISPPFTIKISDASGKSVSKEFTITVKKAAPELVLNEVSCFVGKKCSANLVNDASGGTPPYHYQSDTFAKGTPPFGTVVSIDGLLTGKPTKDGEYTFGVCVVDSVGLSKCEQTTATIELGTSTYSGEYSGSGEFNKPFPEWGTTCTFENTYSGTMTLELTEQGDSVSGTATINGIWLSTALSGSTTEFTCLDGDAPMDDTADVSGTKDNIRFTWHYYTAGGSEVTDEFTGSMSADGKTITGTATDIQSCCTGSGSMSATLTKEEE